MLSKSSKQYIWKDVYDHIWQTAVGYKSINNAVIANSSGGHNPALNINTLVEIYVIGYWPMKISFCESCLKPLVRLNKAIELLLSVPMDCNTNHNHSNKKKHQLDQRLVDELNRMIPLSPPTCSIAPSGSLPNILYSVAEDKEDDTSEEKCCGGCGDVMHHPYHHPPKESEMKHGYGIQNMWFRNR